MTGKQDPSPADWDASSYGYQGPRVTVRTSVANPVKTQVRMVYDTAEPRARKCTDPECYAEGVKPLVRSTVI